MVIIEMSCNVIFPILTLLFFHFCDSYKILAVLPFPMHSHYSLSSKLVNELLIKGYEVTFVTPFPKNENLTSLHEISVENVTKVLSVTKKSMFLLNQKNVFENIHFVNNFGLSATKAILESQDFQNLLKNNNSYDLLILPQFANEALLPITHHFKAPFLLLSPMLIFSWGSFSLSHHSPSSHIPNLLSTYTPVMSFWHRFWNSIYNTYSIIYHQWVILPQHQKLAEEHFPKSPDLTTLLNNAQFLLMNTHISVNYPRALNPNVREIGGFHFKKPKKLPSDLESYLNNSPNGVILFSMGSNIKSSDFPIDKREIFIRTFSKLKINVLWKMELDELPNQPKNVKIMKWIPQLDVLSHPKLRIFITHGGLFSTMESVQCGKPVIGIPIFTDQKVNMAMAEESGYGISLNLRNLTENGLFKAIEKILNQNNSYTFNAQKRSQLIREEPVNLVEKTLFWIDYAIRHPHSDKFFQINYPWYYNSSILEHLTLLLILLVLILIISIRFLLVRK